MKLKCTLLLLSLALFFAYCNNDAPPLSPAKERSEYNFQIFKGWKTERIILPIEFAPEIHYKGVEDLRFSPGWEFPNSKEHWSYAFLWWLDGKVQFDTAVIRKQLEEYYFGLLSVNVRNKHIPANKVIRPKVLIEKAKTQVGDLETYKGTLTMVNYLAITFPIITLNYVIHKKDCKTHTAMLFELSPQPATHEIWKQLNELNTSFHCGKTN